MNLTKDDISEHIREIAILDEFDGYNIPNEDIAQMAFRYCKTFGYNLLDLMFFGIEGVKPQDSTEPLPPFSTS